MTRFYARAISTQSEYCRITGLTPIFLTPIFRPDYGTHECNCHYVCDPGDFPPHCPMECDWCPNYDTSTNNRGNVTKVTQFSDATLETDSNASVHTMSYDVTGNVIQASMSCCQLKTIEYSATNQYAYPTKQTKGTAPTQLITQAAYDFNTGLVVNTTDENDQPTTFTYDADSLRTTRVDLPNGAWSATAYNDTSFPYSVESTSSLDAARSVSSITYVNGAGQAFRTRSLTANGYLSNDVEFDELGRAVKSFNPYTVTSLTDARPSGIKSSSIIEFDALGRVLQTKLQDDTIVQSEYSGTVATLTDQAGKKRRQLADELGRIVRVDEPDANGNLGALTTPVQPTYYEYDGNDNLTKVTQSDGTVTQERVFVYDSLSRLIRERQVEATPTLDDTGVKGTPGATKWTGVYKYNTDSLLTEGIDARGVKTTLAYDGLNRVSTVTYTGESGYQTPQVTYTYSEAETGFYNVGRLTKVATAQISVTGGQFTPATEQNYDYDKVGQIVKHSQSIDGNAYNLAYGYNLAGQLVSETYPSGRVIATTVDNYGVPQTVADAQRTYVSGITFSYNANGMTSQMTLGNGTVENNVLNERFQLTSQSLTRGTDIQQKYDYSYGSVDLATGSVDATKNNGQLGKIESFIGANKQWSQRFGYDELGRLKEAREYKQGDNAHQTYKQVFDFDRFGNLYRKATSNPTTGQENPLAFTPIENADIDRATNRLAASTTYNEAGQVVTDNKFREIGFGYDANGRQIKATKANTPDALTVYDALGNRVATKVNDVWQNMVYDALGQLVAEYGQSSNEGVGGVKYVFQDWQGSVRAITNSNGYVVARTDHQAFGEEVGSGIGLRSASQGYASDKVTRQGYGMTENDDATGQQHAWFRKLETAAGRWDSPDPYKGSIKPEDPQTFNRYSYVNNQPTNLVDPSGLMPPICHAEEGGSFFCTGGWGSGGGDYSYNPYGRGGGYYGADAGYGTITVTTTIRDSNPFEPVVLYSSTSVFTVISPFGGFGGSGGIDRDILELGFIAHLSQVSDKCNDALNALKLTSKKIIDAFDNAVFKPVKSWPLNKAHANYCKGAGLGSTITTRNGMIDFSNGTINSPMTLLLHELVHVAAKLNDQEVYNRIKNAGISIPLATKTETVKGKSITSPDYSQSVSDFFNNNCN